MKGIRYALVLGLTLVALGAAAAFVILNLRVDQRGTAPVAIGSPSAPAPGAAPGPATPAPAGGPAVPAPPAHPVAPQPQPTEAPAPAPAPVRPPWRPSPEQALRDSVFRLTHAGREAEAAALLDRWIETHPADTAALRTSARLLVNNGSTEPGLLRYRALLGRDSSDATRAEYAAALLAAGRSDEAAETYRTLLAAEPESAEYRRGLGRALVWGGHPREGALTLEPLVPGDTAAATLLGAARRSYEPGAAEAARWVRDRPGDRDSRLALARALVREGRPDQAAAQYDTLLASAADLALLREAAGVHAAAGDSLGTARLLESAVMLAPADTALRHDYAKALAWSGDRQGAIREYTVLLQQRGDPDLLFARGQLYLLSGDDRSAEVDLRASAATRPSYAASLLLGDLYRWRGDASRAEAAYRDALGLRPGDPVALAGLDRTRREAKAGRPRDEAEGFSSTTRFIADNAGFDFVATGLEAGVGVGGPNRTVLFASGDVRRVSRDTTSFPGTRRVDGFSLQGGVGQWLGHLRASASGGLLHHEDVPDIAIWSGKVEVVQPSVRVGVGVTRTAAYETLRAGRTLGPAVSPGADPALRATALTGTVAAAAGGGVEIWASAERLWLSDDNRRTAVNLAVTYPLGAGFSAVYSGGGLGFATLDPGYWSPSRYVLQAAGLEYRLRRPSGLTLALRGLPGVAFLNERATPGGPTVSRSVFQWSVTLDLAYRRPRWEVGVFGGYGRDRSDTGYEAGSGVVRARWYW